MVFKANFWA